MIKNRTKFSAFKIDIAGSQSTATSFFLLKLLKYKLKSREKVTKTDLPNLQGGIISQTKDEIKIMGIYWQIIALTLLISPGLRF